MKDSHRAMGWLAAHNRYVHLFLDGLYWGVYDLAERPDASFAASYLGGKREDYDAVNESEAKDGTTDAYDRLRSMSGFSSPTRYDQLRQRLDVTEYIDYLLLNYYGGNRDWGENKNWYAIRRRQPAGPFRFYVWDGEQVLQGFREDIVNRPYEIPFRLSEQVRELGTGKVSASASPYATPIRLGKGQHLRCRAPKTACGAPWSSTRQPAIRKLLTVGRNQTLPPLGTGWRRPRRRSKAFSRAMRTSAQRGARRQPWVERSGTWVPPPDDTSPQRRER
jgi:hypothetical protein